MSTTALILPGIGNSGPDHWQTLWEAAHPSFMRVKQRDWDKPVCEEWVESLEKHVVRADNDVVLVAHSLACLVVVHWAARTRRTVKGALLVAPPDPDGTAFPKEATGFSPPPAKSLAFPSIVVASSNDPYGSLRFAEACAAAWGSRFINAGALGHINANSGIGEWHEGFALFQQLAGDKEREAHRCC